MTTIPTGSLPPLVVNSDPVAVAKALTPSLVAVQVIVVVVAFAAVFVASISASVSGLGSGLLAASPIMISLAFMVFVLVRTATNIGSHSTSRPVLTVDDAGLASTIPQGTITVPWSALESVSVAKRGRHRIVTFRVTPGTTADTPGVESTLKPADFRYLVKKGYKLGSAGIDVPIQTVLDAAAAFTRGRLVAR
jgi:hypothetical protein